MKKTTFITIVLSAISMMFFAIGMCMALIPEWNAFNQGIIFGSIGIVLGIITIITYRRMASKSPVEISGRMIASLLAGIAGALLLGIGMCFSMVWNNMILGIIVGIIGIAVLLSLIPIARGFKD